MAAKWSGYFKVVTPRPTATKMYDNQNMTDGGSYNNFSWYQRLVQGSASRMTSYREFDLMDRDIEVARALDTIAEEMTGNAPKSKEPLQLQILTEDEDNIESTAVLTLKAALRRWCQLHDFSTRLYNISRVCVKFGDIFFRKGTNVNDPWMFVHPKNIMGAIVDKTNVTKVLAWQVKSGTLEARSNGYGHAGGKQDSQIESEIIPVEQMVRFTLSDDMADTQPFGESILRTVFRSHKQKELLEDAIIIYRVQRAPERRVFYIDVGKMPPQRVKQYLEGIKNEIKQKKIPTINGGQQEVDSVYNPHSMCLALDTEIPLLDGRTLKLEEMITEHAAGKENWVYSINPETGEVVPGVVSWAGITRKNTKTIKLILDNGAEIVCTPDHKFPIQGKGFVEAKDITPEDSLFPFKTKHSVINPTHQAVSKYQEIYNPATKGWQYTHRMVGKYMKRNGFHTETTFLAKNAASHKGLIHHISFDSMDNTPSNLTFMNYRDHSAFHHNLANNQQAQFSVELFNIFEKLVEPDIKTINFLDMLSRISNDSEFMDLYKSENQPKTGKKYKIKTDKIRQKLFIRFLQSFGYKNWKVYQQSKIQQYMDVSNLKEFNDYNSDDINLVQYLFGLIKNVSIHNYALLTHFKENALVWDEFCVLYEKVFTKTNNMSTRTRKLSVPEHKVFERIATYFNYDNFKHMVNESSNFNHRVVRIEAAELQDTGTLTIDGDEKYHNHHTFALTHCFVKNSEDFFFASRDGGKGSRVETLPGGAGLGELADLEYFQHKVWRGLKIPVSYMTEQSDGGQVWNDGQVGTAYIQELRFSLYIERLQGQIERTLDVEFKKFLRQANIIIDESAYRIMLPPPSNFGKYKQLELDSRLLGSYTTADGIEYMSKRFVMKRYLQMTDDEIITNERLKREELGIDPDSTDPKDLQSLYGSDTAGGAGAGGDGGFGDFGGAELGMDAETDKPAPAEDAGGPQDGDGNPV